MNRKVLRTYEVTNDPGKYHIPGIHNMQVTLCGFVDVPNYHNYSYKDRPCNCVGCLDAYKAIKAMQFPRGYFTHRKEAVRG